MSRTDHNRRTNWFREYESKLVALFPELTGKMDWPTAIYLYNQRLTVDQAVERAARIEKPTNLTEIGF